MTSHIDLTLTLGQDLWISEHFMWHRLLKHFFPGSSQIFWFLSLCSQHSPSEQTPLLQIKCFLQGITNHCKPFNFLTISYQQEIFLCTQQRPNLVPNDLSVGSTETKYIKLKTKPQNNIVISGIFYKNWYYYCGFFWKKLTEIRVFTNKWALLVFGFLVF